MTRLPQSSEGREAVELLMVRPPMPRGVTSSARFGELVRELENVLARALAFVDASASEPEHREVPPHGADDREIESFPLAGRTLETIERAAIKQTLALTGGMKVRAAEMLGIAVSTLYQKLKKYGL